MGMLDFYQARYFVKGYKSRTGATRRSFRKWADELSIHQAFLEGTPNFDLYREMALCEVERLLFLAASNYRRSFDLQIASASSWAYVTLYYGAFYSAKAILGSFGTWKLRKAYILDVADGVPGSQRFVVQSKTFTYNGPHQSFWEYFYSVIPSLSPWIDPSLRFSITPVSGNPAWQIDTRNDLNYDTFEAFNLISTYQHNYRSSRFIVTLPNVLNTQFKIMEGLLMLASKFARELGISTNELDIILADGNKRTKYNKLILDVKRPKIERFICRSALR